MPKNPGAKLQCMVLYRTKCLSKCACFKNGVSWPRCAIWSPSGLSFAHTIWSYPWSCWLLIFVLRGKRQRNVLLSVCPFFAWLLCPCSLSVLALLVVFVFGVLPFSGAWCVCVCVCVDLLNRSKRVGSGFLQGAGAP